MCRKLLFSVSLVVLVASGCVPRGVLLRGRPIRVAVLQGAGAVTLSSRSVLTVKDRRSGKVLGSARRGSAVTIRVARSGLEVSGVPRRAPELIVSSTANEISLNGKSYPGSFRILRRQGGILAVNLVDIETYVKGVVPCEMLATWPPESLKAQAVASRSFAVYHALRNSGEDYDILSSAQVYDPGRRDRRSSKAVDATKNLVLFYRKKLLLPFFSTCCGGYTEYPANVWGSEGQFPPPVACPYCREEPGFQWRARVAVADFREKLRSAGIPGARSVAVHGRSSSGERITALKVKCDDGRDRIVRINRFRMILGPNVIRSGFFESEVEDGYIVFSGRGWGHGVGMCQRGAKVLAERGESFGSILRYYFPGAVMRKMRW